MIGQPHVMLRESENLLKVRMLLIVKPVDLAEWAGRAAEPAILLECVHPLK